MPVRAERGPRWSRYAIQALWDAEKAATATGQRARLHLWPDHQALGATAVVKQQPDPEAYLEWLQSYWNRISEWPLKRRKKR